MELILIWLVLSILVAVLASSYGRSGVGWFLFSALLSPVIAGIGLLAVGRKRADAGPTKKCPDCAQHVSAEARACMHCGHRFLPPESPEEAETRESAASARLRNRRLLALLIVAGMAYIIYNGNT